MRPDLWRPMSSPGTSASGSYSRAPAPPPCASLERTRFGFTERPESSHRPLAWRSHLPCREDGGTTQGAFRCFEFPACLRKAMWPFSLTDPTLHSAWQSRESCRPCDVLAWRPRTVSLGPRFPGASAAKTRALGATPDRPSRLSLSRESLRHSASADRTACDGLAHPLPTCLAAVRGARARCVSTNVCFPLLRLRVLAPLVFPASFRGLRLARPTMLAHRRGRLDGLALHGAKASLGGRLGFAYGVVVHTPPNLPCLLTPLSLIGQAPWLSLRNGHRLAETTAASAPWRATHHFGPRRLPSRALPRPPRGALVSWAVTWGFPLRAGADVLSRPTVRALARLAQRWGVRPRTAPNRVKWSRPLLYAKTTSHRLLQRRIRRASATPSVQSSLPHAAGGRFRPRRMLEPLLPVRAVRRVRRAIPLAFDEGGAASRAPPTPPFSCRARRSESTAP